MKAQGKDYGGYTIVDESQVKPGFETDFKIVGIAWGTTINPTWEFNKPDVKKQTRRMLYHFFNHAPPWEKQADLFLKELESVDAHLAMLDWERSSYGVREDMNMEKQAKNAWRIAEKLRANFDGRRLWYANFNDYILAQNYIPLETIDWCVAWPDESPDSHPGNSYWWNKIKRPYLDYKFDQWSWKGYAPNYGATNDKKSMDLMQCKHDLAWLDNWLGITDVPPPELPAPTGDYKEGFADGLERAEQEIKAIER